MKTQLRIYLDKETRIPASNVGNWMRLPALKFYLDFNNQMIIQGLNAGNWMRIPASNVGNWMRIPASNLDN